MKIPGVFLIVCLLVKPLACSNSSDENRLVVDLLHRGNYLPYVKPGNSTLKLSFGMALIQIMNLDESSQVLHTLAWLRKNWRDDRLTRNPDDYGGIDHVRIPGEKLWRPDVILYNSAKDKWEYSVDPLAVVSSDGNVLYIPPIHLHSSCSLDLIFFPYDTQHCQLKFGSWTYDGFSVDISFFDNLEAIDLNDYIANNDWVLVETPARKNVKYYPCCHEPYPDLTFKLKMRRHNVHYAYTLVGPSVILALIIPLVFLLPPGSQEKTSLGAGVLVGLILLALTLQSMLPPTGYFLPVIALYNLACVGMTGCSLAFATIVNAAWWKRGNLPGVVRTVIIKGLGKVTCVSPENYRRMSLEDPRTSEDKVAVLPPDGKPLGDWQLLAIILDRLLLVLFLLVTLIITILFHSV